MDQTREAREQYENAAVLNLPPLPAALFDPNRSCRDFDWINFVPYDRAQWHTSDYRDAAQLLCADCPVRTACLQHARDADEFGLWGGWFFNPKTGVQINLLLE